MNAVKYVFVITFFLLPGLFCKALAAPGNAGSELAPELAGLAPYLGSWQASFTMGGKEVTDVSQWQRALNGNAIRIVHSINDGDYGGESLIFFDKSRKQLVFFYFTTADFFTSGTISLNPDNSFIASEEVSGNTDGISRVESTNAIINGEMQVATRYFKAGQWSAAETRSYSPSTKAVIFK
jgi:hypothetical protein